MLEYETLGDMFTVDSVRGNKYRQSTFYLPHRGIINEDSCTTKLCVVFDGLSKSSNRVLLKDTVMVVPTLQDELFSILVCYQKQSFVFKADVKKMYRMVNVNRAQRNCQRIVQRSNPGKPIAYYVLNMVTYVLSSAFNLAIHCLQQIGIDNKNIFSEISEIILSDFYVDDVLSGTETVS